MTAAELVRRVTALELEVSALKEHLAAHAAHNHWVPCTPEPQPDRYPYYPYPRPYYPYPRPCWPIWYTTTVGPNIG